MKKFIGNCSTMGSSDWAALWNLTQILSGNAVNDGTAYCGCFFIGYFLEANQLARGILRIAGRNISWSSESAAESYNREFPVWGYAFSVNCSVLFSLEHDSDGGN